MNLFRQIRRTIPSAPRSMSTFSRLIRFKTESGLVHIGQPIGSQDVGLAAHNKETISVEVYSGNSILNPGKPTGETSTVHELLCPIEESEIGTIRCIGLNYRKHAAETGMDLPTVPILFIKPSTALNGPGELPIPRVAQDGTADFESELCVIIGKDARDVSEENAFEHVLGYTSSNDVSSRNAQFAQSQWGYSKGFDKACPIGPVVISTATDPSTLFMRGLLNGEVMQETSISDLVFDIPKLISFLSQGTTLKAGSIILTGTPFGVGFTRVPKVHLKDGDDFRVEISGGIGTLISNIVYEK